MWVVADFVDLENNPVGIVREWLELDAQVAQTVRRIVWVREFEIVQLLGAPMKSVRSLYSNNTPCQFSRLVPNATVVVGLQVQVQVAV